jgi:hypothetical protein
LYAWSCAINSRPSLRYSIYPPAQSKPVIGAVVWS